MDGREIYRGFLAGATEMFCQGSCLQADTAMEHLGPSSSQAAGTAVDGKRLRTSATSFRTNAGTRTGSVRTRPRTNATTFQ